MVETGEMKTYFDAIEAILNKSIMLSPELLDQVESLIRDNPQLGVYYQRRVHTGCSAL
jgi:hypothetical protein